MSLSILSSVIIQPAHAQSLSPTKPTQSTNRNTLSLPFITSLLKDNNSNTITSFTGYLQKQKQEKEAAMKAQQALHAALAAKLVADAELARLAATEAAKPHSAPFVAGNDYDWGNCTWFVANRTRIPSGLGNARDWYYAAQAMGILVGDTPHVGSVAWEHPGRTLGHVAYVEATNSDGSILISEMNVMGLGKIDQRVISLASNWSFIYFNE